jgi:hypothetical protein
VLRERADDVMEDASMRRKTDKGGAVRVPLSLCTSSNAQPPPDDAPFANAKISRIATPFLVSFQYSFYLPIGYTDIVMASQARRGVVHD